MMTLAPHSDRLGHALHRMSMDWLAPLSIGAMEVGPGEARQGLAAGNSPHQDLGQLKQRRAGNDRLEPNSGERFRDKAEYRQINHGGDTMNEAKNLGDAYAMTKLRPEDTGLPMAVWVTENEGFRHDVRVKVSRIHGGRGAWSGAASVAVRPQPHLVVGNLSTADLQLVNQWIELNRATIIDYWNGALRVGEMLARLQKLPP
jgi:hypothetical protein